MVKNYIRAAIQIFISGSICYKRLMSCRQACYFFYWLLNLESGFRVLREFAYFYNMIFVSEKAQQRVLQIMQESGYDPEAYFLRVSVVSGGCSGLSYKLDFDKELKPKDQEFEDKGIRIVTDLRSFLYLVNTTLDFSDGLNGKGFYFNNPNASRSCSCGESFAV